VWERANSTCEYCRIPQAFDVSPFSIDHIIARQHNGPAVAQNLALACYNCNAHKGPNIAGLDPKTRRITRLFHPRRDKWDEHFRWIGAKLVGKSGIGRTTVAVLGINLPIRFELRRSLKLEGVFPFE
jgi:hypothetical protein